MLEADNLDCTPAMAEWIIQELVHSNIFDHRAMIRVFNGDVVKCDTRLPDSFLAELQDAVKSEC
ncbi:hypothetical protein CPB83DRAFT_849835 [Crepidotus variabilis]|uniref:Uncharacterized protein n=1 Tax=Crepidotus variabilis TaxID=179855 RepID=A0A9P6JRK3_9AGAR|nr:hypothetical protein CPB83DRAFT_849835 [Crepidotus variabilis]